MVGQGIGHGTAPGTDGKAADGDGELRVLRFRDRHAALGNAVVHLMGKPGFARLPFGEWSRVLVGQVNRDHYFFVARGQRLVGFLGWVRVGRAEAEAWYAGRGEAAPALSDGPEGGRQGDCIIVNAWQADDAAAHAFIRQQLRRMGEGVHALYGRRSYPDGRDRLVRLSVTGEILARHVAPQKDPPEGPPEDPGT